MREDIFILIIGHGRGGTSAVMGFFNSFPGINVGSEQNQVQVGKKIYPELSEEFNGNKIVMPDGIGLSFADIVVCIENRIGLIHERFNILKLVFVTRDPIDNLCSKYVRARNSGSSKYKGFTLEGFVDDWIYNTKVLNTLGVYFGKNCFGFDFYEFLEQDKIKEDLLNWVGIDYSVEDLNKKVPAGIYGDNFLSMDVMFFGPKSHEKYSEERKEIESLLINRLGEDWRSIAPAWNN